MRQALPQSAALPRCTLREELHEQWLAEKVRCGKAVSTCILFARHARNVGATDFKQRVESGTLRNATVLARDG